MAEAQNGAASYARDISNTNSGVALAATPQRFMTQEEMHIAVAEWTGIAGKYHIQKDGWFYKQNKCGYVQLPQNAGVFSEQVAMAEAKSCPEVRAVKTTLPPLTLDWLHECEEKAPARYWGVLEEVTGAGIHSAPAYYIKSVAHATKEQRLEALCRTLFPERFKCHANTCQP